MILFALTEAVKRVLVLVKETKPCWEPLAAPGALAPKTCARGVGFETATTVVIGHGPAVSGSSFLKKC